MSVLLDWVVFREQPARHLISIHCSLQHIVILFNMTNSAVLPVLRFNIGKQIETIHFQWDEVDIRGVTAFPLQLMASLARGYVLLQTRETTKHPLFSITPKNRDIQLGIVSEEMNTLVGLSHAINEEARMLIVNAFHLIYLD